MSPRRLLVTTVLLLPLAFSSLHAQTALFPQAGLAIRVMPDRPLVLDGSTSVAPGGRAVRFWDWELLVGPRGTAGLPLRSQDPLLRIARGLPEGRYVFGLRVTDADGRVSPPTTLTVIASRRDGSAAVSEAGALAPPRPSASRVAARWRRNAPSPAPPSPAGPGASLSPVADAGPDRALPAGAPLTLDGSASRPGRSGRISRYRWEKLSGPLVRVPMPLETADGKLWVESHPEPGTYVFRLTVTDSSGRRSASDEVRITVGTAAPAPASSPGPSRPDGGPVVSAPPTSPVARPGAPTANAGRDGSQTSRQPLQLDGSASKAAPGRSIRRYRWRLVEGPVMPVLFPIESTMPRLYLMDRPEAGRYVFELVVFDDLGVSSTPVRVTRTVRR